MIKETLVTDKELDRNSVRLAIIRHAQEVTGMWL
jgi:hypothetical protein